MHLPRPSLSMPPALGFSASSFPPQIHQGEVPDIERPTPCNFVVAPPLPPSASLPPSLPLLPPSLLPLLLPLLPPSLPYSDQPASSSPPHPHQLQSPSIN